MKKRYLIGLVVIALFLLIFRTLGLHKEADRPTDASEPLTAKSKQAAAEPLIIRQPNRMRAAHPSVAFESMGSEPEFDEMARRLELVWRNDQDAYWLLVRTAMACGPSVPRVSGDTYTNWWQTHVCAGRRLGELARYQNFDPATLRSELFKSLDDENSGLVPSNAPIADQIIRQSNSAFELREAGGILTNTADHEWMIGSEQVRNTPLARQLGELQRAAVELLACRVSPYAGCGPDELLSMNLCSHYRLCTRGVTVESIYLQIYSSQELGVIRSILQELYRRRAGA